jgi:hypothetical protein
VWNKGWPFFQDVVAFFFILVFFNQTLRNEPVQNSPSNPALFSHTTPVGANYEGVASYALA